MLNPTDQVERIAAAGRTRAAACGAGFAGVGIAGFRAAIGHGWTPSAMPVPVVKHDLTPAPRPEEAVPR